jgi:cytochrome c553
MRAALLSLLLLALAAAAFASEHEAAREIVYPDYGSAPAEQTPAQADAKSAGCVSCHDPMDEPSMHRNPAVVLGCTDCHGGDATVSRPGGAEIGAPDYDAATALGHVQPRHPAAWAQRGPGNPERSYTLLNREAPEFVRFVNPGDLRVARFACGACHAQEVTANERSLMATGAMLWGGASYNNGICPSNATSWVGVLHAYARGVRRENDEVPAHHAPREDHGHAPADAGRARARRAAALPSASGLGDDPAGRRLPRLRARRDPPAHAVPGDRKPEP